jgi:subtilase family serine protease
METSGFTRAPGAHRARRAWAGLIVSACLIPVVAMAASGRPSLLAHSTDLGPVNASNPIEVTLWLKLHDEPGLDKLIQAQQAGNAAYLSNDQVLARHAPGAAQAATVSAFLESQGLRVTGVGQDELFVKASGTVAQVQSTFHVELHQYEFNGRSFHASSRSATLPPELAPLVAAVGGLSDLGAEPQIAYVNNKIMASSVHRTTDAEGLAPQPHPLGAAANGLFFSAQCFYPPTTVNFAGSSANATYQGNRYGANINNTAFGTLSPCGYQPSDIHTAYNLNPLYREGLDGTGTTIAIVDAYGSTTIANDVAAFSALMGLPPAQLTIIGTPTESNFSGDANTSWATETTLDVEWVHAIAPGAKIVLVVAPTNSFSDLFNGIVTAASVPGVVSISNSWSGYDLGVAGDFEFYAPADGILKVVGAAGQSVNFSTGDGGNNASVFGGTGTSTGWPGSSPYATAVGGVSVALDAQKHIAWQTSWGTNLTEIADTVALGSPPIDPPNNEGFIYGGTGGASDIYPKPFWQIGVPGDRRQTPDIAWVADPYTGLEIIYTGDTSGDLFFTAVGGTSASCPMFSALWGIATQRAHHRLGQAAPYLYRLPQGAITDVTAPASPENVTGTIQDSGGTNPIRASELAAPLQNLPSFISALYNSPHSTRWFVITFGLDSTLPTGPGWDPATGLGTPNGWNFVQSFGY